MTLQDVGNPSKLPVQGTFYAHRTLSHHMSVNHGGLHIGVSQQSLLSQFALPPKSIEQLREVLVDRRNDRRRQSSALCAAFDAIRQPFQSAQAVFVRELIVRRGG